MVRKQFLIISAGVCDFELEFCDFSFLIEKLGHITSVAQRMDLNKYSAIIIISGDGKKKSAMTILLLLFFLKVQIKTFFTSLKIIPSYLEKHPANPSSINVDDCKLVYEFFIEASAVVTLLAFVYSFFSNCCSISVDVFFRLNPRSDKRIHDALRLEPGHPDAGGPHPWRIRERTGRQRSRGMWVRAPHDSAEKAGKKKWKFPSTFFLGNDEFFLLA